LFIFNNKALADPSILNEVTQPIIDNKKCKSLPKFETNTDEMLCAGDLIGGKDACRGDSGGPLFCKFESGVYSQVGVVSWGHDCAKPDMPGVYARVSSFIKWIENTQSSY